MSTKAGEVRSQASALGTPADSAWRLRKIEIVWHWKAVSAIRPYERMLRRVGHIAERFSLCGYDSVHLTAAESLLAVPGAGSLRFASFYAALNEAAQAIGPRLL